MKFLIFFLIFFLLFIPNVNAEFNGSDVNITFLDIKGEPASKSYGKIIEFDGSIWTGGGYIVSENGTLSNFRFSEEQCTKCYYLYIYTAEHYDNKTLIPEKNVRFSSDPIICPGVNTEYIFIVNEIQHKPVELVLYNMTNASLKLANQSKETSDESYNLSKQSEKTSGHSLWLSGFAILLGLISLVSPHLSAVKRIFCREYQCREVLSILFVLMVILMVVRCIQTPADFVWITDFLLN